MKRIYLNGEYNHLFAEVDDEDYDYLVQKNWHYSKGYARTYHNGTYVHMQQLLLKAPKGLVVDHINRNKLDNKKSNLRIVTREQNVLNSDGTRKGKNKFKGVYFKKRANKYEVVVYSKGKRHNIGCFSNEIDAAIAYNEAALRLQGEFARLNVIEED